MMLKLLIVGVLIVAACQANPLLHRTPISINVNKDLDLTNVGPQSFSIEGIMTGVRFDVVLATGPNIMESSTLLSISFRSVTNSVIFSSNLKDLALCFDSLNCFLGQFIDGSYSMDISEGMPINFSFVTDSTYMHIYINGDFVFRVRHRIALRHGSDLLVDGGIIVSNIELCNLFKEDSITPPTEPTTISTSPPTPFE